MNKNKSKPNFLFLLPDQHRPDYLPFNSNVPVVMPNVERLAERGIRFTNAWTPSPLCAPARACLVSGRDYVRCGVPNNRYDYLLDQPTYYQSLRDAGYNVGGVGKFDLHKSTFKWGIDGKGHLKELGFTHGIDNEGKYDALISLIFDSVREYVDSSIDVWEQLERQTQYCPQGPYTHYLQQRGLLKTHIRDYIERRRKGNLAKVTPLPNDAYCDNWLSENALGLLDKFETDRPWHLVVNFTGPHSPFDVTESMWQRWNDIRFPAAHCNDVISADELHGMQQNYAAMLENIDHNIGLLLDKVQQRGELDNTIVIYSSDHGEMLGDYGKTGKNIHRRASCGIPMIIAGPGVVQNKVSNALVSLHDLAPTMIDYAEAEPMNDIDAISLRPLLQDQTVRHRDMLVAGLKGPSLNWRMVIQDHYKLVECFDHADRKMALFDLINDPLETIDISDSNLTLVRQLRDLLWETTGGECH